MSSYSITQVAKQLGIKVHTIRYWEKHVPLLSVLRDEYGKRLYNRQDVYMLIRMQHYIVHKKFTLKGAADALTKEMTAGENTEQRLVLLDVMKKFENQKERLQKVKSLVQSKIKSLKSTEKGG